MKLSKKKRGGASLRVFYSLILLVLWVVLSTLVAWFISQATEPAVNLHKDISILYVLGIMALVVFLFYRFSKYSIIHWIHHNESFVSFAYATAFLIPIVLYGLSNIRFMKATFGAYKYYPLSQLGLLIAAGIPVVVYIGSYLVFRFWSKPLEKLSWRFAAGAVGIKDDSLYFKYSARNYALGILDCNAYVSVYGLYGGMGEGKSSFARMIVEWLKDANLLGSGKFLYTYISLTETNEAKDFSKLFGERWFSTLSERYVYINAPSFFSTLKSIFRDSEGSWITPILSLIDYLNIPLSSMEVKHKDISVEQGEQRVAEEIQMLFGFVPQIHEQIWLVMVDEVERGTLDEIYRLVEILERFKSQGRTGVPTKIVFLLCIAHDELNKYLKTFGSQDTRAYLLKDFFIDNPKNVTHTIYLPPISSNVKEDMTIQELKRLFPIFDVSPVPNWDQFRPSSLINPKEAFIEDSEKALAYATSVIAERTPRDIKRCISEMESFYRSFRDQHADFKINNIRAADIAMLSWVRVVYPEVIEFLRRTVDFLVPSSEDRITREDLERFFRDEKKNIIQWIKDKTGWDGSPYERDITEFFCLSARDWIDYSENVSRTSKIEKYDGSTSYARIMKDYLTSVCNEESDEYRWVKSVYKAHKSGNLKPIREEKSIEKVIMYARTLRHVEGVQLNIRQDVFEILWEWLVENKIPLQRCNVGTTYYDEFIVFLSFYMTDIIERLPPRKDISTYLDNFWGKLDGILSASHIPLGVKYHLMNNFIRDNGRDASGIHYRMVAAFKSVMERKSIEVVMERFQKVFDERNRDYYDGTEVLYEREENFFYTLYQGWTGEGQNMEEISKIRSTALRGLEKYPEAVELYWNQYPTGNRDEIFEELDDWERKGNALYMPIKELIDVTKRAVDIRSATFEKMRIWEELIKDDRYEGFEKVKDDRTTLYAVFRAAKQQLDKG